MKVIKLGGRIQSDPALAQALAHEWRLEPRSLCVVHGGGDEITTFQRFLGREPSFVNGRRVTTDDDMELVRMVLSGSANKRLVSTLCAAGIRAVGISGEDGGLLFAEPIDLETFGRAGKPVKSDVSLIQTLLASDFLPVVSPLATDMSSSGREALNVNGDDAASLLASELGAELWLVADVAGVLDENSELIEKLDQTTTESLVADGTLTRGMHAKVEAGFAALNAGAALVRIAGIDAILGNGGGTLLSLTPSMT